MRNTRSTGRRKTIKDTGLKKYRANADYLLNARYHVNILLLKGLLPLLTAVCPALLLRYY